MTGGKRRSPTQRIAARRQRTAGALTARALARIEAAPTFSPATRRGPLGLGYLAEVTEWNLPTREGRPRIVAWRPTRAASMAIAAKRAAARAQSARVAAIAFRLAERARG